MPAPQPPTRVRYVIVGMAAFAALLMYLDRMCMAQVVASDSFARQFTLSKDDAGYLVSTFFFAYALGQMPAAWLADRFGARALMAAFIAIWSGFTVLTGLASGF